MNSLPPTAQKISEAITALTTELIDPPWLWGIKSNFDDGGVFIEVTVDASKYPVEDPLPRRYQGVPLIVLKRYSPVPKGKN